MRRSSLVLLLIAGCAAPPPAAPPAVLLGQQLRKQDENLIGTRFRTVLDFENKADAAFVRTTAGGVAPGHTGASGLRCGPTASIGLTSVLFGLRLPGDFRLLGAYVRPIGDRVTATLLADGKPIARTQRHVPPGNWAFAAVDLTTDACRQMLPTAKDVRLELLADGGFDLDDVMFTDNRRTLADVPGEWKIERDGLALLVSYAGRPAVRVPTLASGDGGWVIEEASALRVRLCDPAGTKFWTLLADGRTTRGEPTAAPGDITVDPTTGRLDRETPGDTDNDGYNDRRAAFQITARATRLRFTLSNGRGTPLAEIRGLPPESNVVTANGNLIDHTCRLDDGTLLVRLPDASREPIEVTVGVRAD